MIERVGFATNPAEEPEFLLRQKLHEPATYMAIFEAIADGARRP